MHSRACLAPAHALVALSLPSCCEGYNYAYIFIYVRWVNFACANAAKREKIKIVKKRDWHLCNCVYLWSTYFSDVRHRVSRADSGNLMGAAEWTGYCGSYASPGGAQDAGNFADYHSAATAAAAAGGTGNNMHHPHQHLSGGEFSGIKWYLEGVK